MNRQSPSEVIEQIMSILSFPEEFGMNPEENQVIDEEYYYEILSSYYPDVRIHYGVSKFVIDIPSLPFVIKIPFNGMIDNSTGDFYYFENADPRKPSDYCFSEYLKYKEAKENGFACFFAKTEYYDDDYDGTSYYYQEKVNLSYQNSSIHPSADSYKKANSYSAEIVICDSTWIAAAIDCYGQDLVDAFLDYVNNIDPEISQDLHSLNYGYRSNGEPVLFDFSGWHD